MTLTQRDITPREKGAETSSVLRPVRKRKKGRTLGRVDIMRREDYAELELDAKVELIRSLVPLGLMQVEELLDAEVTALAGEHYAPQGRVDRGPPARQQPRDGEPGGAAGADSGAARSQCRGEASFRCAPTRRCVARVR